jgi:hypothetical protein
MKISKGLFTLVVLGVLSVGLGCGYFIGKHVWYAHGAIAYEELEEGVAYHTGNDMLRVVYKDNGTNGSPPILVYLTASGVHELPQKFRVEHAHSVVRKETTIVDLSKKGQ